LAVLIITFCSCVKSKEEIPAGIPAYLRISALCIPSPLLIASHSCRAFLAGCKFPPKKGHPRPMLSPTQGGSTLAYLPRSHPHHGHSSYDLHHGHYCHPQERGDLRLFQVETSIVHWLSYRPTSYLLLSQLPTPWILMRRRFPLSLRSLRRIV